MKTKLVLIALLLAASAHYCQAQARCQSGEYVSADGRCLPDQTGDRYVVGDGCNIATCLDQACQNTAVTTVACTNPPAKQVLAGSERILNLNLSAHFDAVSVTIYPTGNKMMDGIDKSGKVVFTVYRDGRIILAKPENHPAGQKP